MSKRGVEGFTLTELLIVVLIVGVLAAIAVPVFLGQRAEASRSAVASDLRNVSFAMEDGYLPRYAYPSAAEMTPLQSPGVTLTIVRPPPGENSYCVRGTHADLPGEMWSLDSLEGRVRPGDCTP